eukprot:scaffold323987_cov22-Prasinocladus_malaysianus.AAC.1
MPNQPSGQGVAHPKTSVNGPAVSSSVGNPSISERMPGCQLPAIDQTAPVTQYGLNASAEQRTMAQKQGSEAFQGSAAQPFQGGSALQSMQPASAPLLLRPVFREKAQGSDQLPPPAGGQLPLWPSQPPTLQHQSQPNLQLGTQTRCPQRQHE